MPITIVKGNILDFEGDFIVNPANSFLNHAGGLAKIIADAAAPHPGDEPDPNADDAEWKAWDDLAFNHDDWTKEQESHPNIPVGSAGATSAGILPYKAIIHAVGPIWDKRRYQEDVALYNAHVSAIRKARSIAHSRHPSIAFPAISCGIFGYPVRLAAPIAIKAAIEKTENVTFYLYSDEHYDTYTKALKEILK